MTDNQKPLLVDAGRGFCVYWQGRALYPTKDPEFRVAEKALRCDWPDETLILVPSPLLYYGFKDLLAGLPPQCFILVYEHEPELRALGPTTKDPRLFHLNEFSENDVKAVLEDVGLNRVRRVKVLRLTSGQSLHPQVYDSLEKKLEEEIQTFWKNRMTSMRLGTLWLKNLFKNLPLLSRYPALNPTGDDSPLVIAGAGPSLELALPALKKYRDRLTLVCVDTALPVLAALEIDPDLVVAVESQHFNLDDFSYSKGRPIGLAADLTAHPGTFRVLSGPTFFFASRFAQLQLLNRLEEAGLWPYPMDPWGSVGVTAVAALGLQESREVYLTGLDFCFDTEKSHSRGSPAHRKVINGTTRFKAPTQSPGIWSRPFFTGPDFPGYSDGSLRFYAQRLRYLLEGKKRVWDIRQGGWDLGINRLTIAQWTRDLEAVPPVKQRFEVKPSTIKLEKVKKFLSEEKERLIKLRTLFEELNNGIENPVMEEALKEMDYLYFAFPDGGGKPLMNSSFLSRVKVSLSYFLSLVHQILEDF